MTTGTPPCWFRATGPRSVIVDRGVWLVEGIRRGEPYD